MERLFLIPILHQTTTIDKIKSVRSALFLIPILHQTTTALVISESVNLLFLIPILHQTTTVKSGMRTPVWLFLIPILHQTTTLKRLLCGLLSCSSFQFYIKPQPITASSLFIPVVPHSNSTSNHNFHLQFRGKLFVVPHSNSTSNHNMVARLWKLTALFLIPILHQTTTSRMAVIHILHVTHMTPMHKTSCRTPGKLVGCNFVFQRAIYQKNSSC